MKHYSKTFFGSIVAFVLGTSCCWLSSMAIWFGGAALVGIIGSFFENIQTLLLILGVGFGITTVFLYFKKSNANAKTE